MAPFRVFPCGMIDGVSSCGQEISGLYQRQRNAKYSPCVLGVLLEIAGFGLLLQPPFNREITHRWCSGTVTVTATGQFCGSTSPMKVRDHTGNRYGQQYLEFLRSLRGIMRCLSKKVFACELITHIGTRLIIVNNAMAPNTIPIAWGTVSSAMSGITWTLRSGSTQRSTSGQKEEIYGEDDA